MHLLQKELQRIPDRDKAAYLSALARCPGEVLGSWRWETFIERKDNFDVKRTAKDLVEYWKRRLALFGEDRCYLPMTLAGAMQDDVANMMVHDPQQLSPVKDMAGRTIFVITPSRRDRSLYTTKSQCRAFWYQLECISQDVETRRNGFVVLMNGTDTKPSNFDPRFGRFGFSSIDLFPVEWKAFHLFHANFAAAHIFVAPCCKVHHESQIGESDRGPFGKHQ